MTEKTETELFGNERRFFELIREDKPTEEDVQEIKDLITKDDINFNKRTDILFGAPAIVFLAQRLNNAIKEGNGDLESKLTEIIKIFLNSPKVDINQQYERDGKVYNTFVLLYDNEELRNKIIERNNFHTTNIKNLFNNEKIENIAELTDKKKQEIIATLQELANKRLQEGIEKDKKLLEEYKQKLENGEALDDKEYSKNIGEITIHINNAKNIINSKKKEMEEEEKRMKDLNEIDPFNTPKQNEKNHKEARKIEEKLKKETNLYKIEEKKSALLELNILLNHVMSLAISKKNEKTVKPEDKTINPSTIKFKTFDEVNKKVSEQNRNRGNSLNLNNSQNVEQEVKKERPKSIGFFKKTKNEKTTSSSDLDEKKENQEENQEESLNKTKKEEKQRKKEEKQRIRKERKAAKKLKEQQAKNQKAKNQTKSKKLGNLDSDFSESLLGSEIENNQHSLT